MDNKPTRLTQDDMGLVSRRFIRLDGYQPLGDIRGTNYQVEFCLRGKQTELFIMPAGQLACLVDRFLELVSLLIGNSRIDSITEQAANAMFHGLGCQLAELLQAGRGNIVQDCLRSANLDDDEQPGVSEGNSTGTSNASIPAPLRTSSYSHNPKHGEEWEGVHEAKGDLPSDAPLGQGSFDS